MSRPASWGRRERLLPVASVSAAHRSADNLLKNAGFNKFDDVFVSHGLIRRVHIASRQLRDFVRSQNLWAVARDWIGEDVRLCSLCLSIRTESTISHPLHSDAPHTGVRGDRCVTALIPLVPIGIAEGGTYFVSEGKEHRPELQIGDVLFWNGNALHTSGEVAAGMTRKALIARWVSTDQVLMLPEEYRPSMDAEGRFSTTRF